MIIINLTPPNNLLTLHRLQTKGGVRGEPWFPWAIKCQA